LADPTVSRHHAIITVYEGGAFLIRDLESKNGTLVDGKLIGPTPVVVSDRAKIEFGAVTVSVRFKEMSTTQGLRLKLPHRLRRAPSAS
jgi:pSer/pThr/pTyr-binding forkhead associated (FHA) protein